MDVVLTIDLRCFLGFPISYSSSSKSWTERGFLCYLCDPATHEHLSAKNVPPTEMNLLLCLPGIQHLPELQLRWQREKEVRQVCRDRSNSLEKQNSPSSTFKEQGQSQPHILVGPSLSVTLWQVKGRWCQSVKVSKTQTQKHLTSSQGILHKNLLCKTKGIKD